MVEEGDQLGGDAAQVREALALDRRQHRGGVEGVVDQGDAQVGDLHRDPRHRPDVGEGEARGEVPLLVRHAPRMPARLDVGDGEEARMRVPGAFRRARGAAREDDGDGVGRVDRDGGRRGRLARQRRHHPGRALSQLVGVEPEHAGELRQLVAHRLDDRAEVDLVPAVDGEQEPRAGLPEHVPDLAPPVADVEAGGHRAEAGGGQVADEVQRCRGQQQRDDAAPLDAVGPEGGGQAVGEQVPVAIREPLVPIAEGLGPGRLAGGRAEEVAQGSCGGHGPRLNRCGGTGLAA